MIMFDHMIKFHHMMKNKNCFKNTIMISIEKFD